nr:hypothetical protein [Tanacetum cinerariifolium]
MATDHEHLDMVKVSLNSVMGFTPTRTMKLSGNIGDQEVAVLIDCRATHNFISSKIVEELGLAVSDSRTFNVTLGNGETTRSKGICKGLVVVFLEIQVFEDLLPLELGSTDAILGIKWLQTLGDVKMNWKLLTMKFMVGLDEIEQLLWESRDNTTKCESVLNWSVEEHEVHLRMVLQILREQKLYANRKKCSFAQEQIEYLRHVVTPNRVEADPSKVKAMLEWPVPKSIRELRGFLGLTGYYRKFVKGHSKIASPLTDQPKKDSFKWNKEANQGFETLRTTMSTLPVLVLPDFSQTFVVEADASRFRIGTVLLQNKRAITYFSQVLGLRARLKSVYERELMAIVLAIQHQRWLSKLVGYDFEIQYRPRIENRVADALSCRGEYPKLVALSIPWVIDCMDGQRLLYKGRLVIPRYSPWIPKLFCEFHNSVVGGHSGALKTQRRMAKEVY